MGAQSSDSTRRIRACMTCRGRLTPRTRRAAVTASERHDEPTLVDEPRPGCTRRPPSAGRPSGSCSRTGPTRTTAPRRTLPRLPGRSARSRRPACAPCSIACSQCSTRIDSPKWGLGHHAMSPAATIPGAASVVASQTTPLSTVRPDPSSQPVVGDHPDADDHDVGGHGGAVGQPHAGHPAVPESSPRPRRRAGRRRPPRGAVVRRSDRLEWQDPTHGLGQRLDHGDLVPRPRQVAETSAPMNPAPITTTRPGRRSRSSRTGEALVQVAQHVDAGQRLAVRFRRGDAPMASTIPSACTVDPSAIVEGAARGGVERLGPCTPGQLRVEVVELVGLGWVAVSGSHSPDSTCLDSGGRSVGNSGRGLDDGDLPLVARASRSASTAAETGEGRADAADVSHWWHSTGSRVPGAPEPAGPARSSRLSPRW